MKNVICIIARNNSKRLPHKTIRELNGKRTVEIIIDAMKEVENVDEIYVCTSVDEEDKILVEIAEQSGVKAYAGSRDSVIDRMLDVAEIENADNIMRVTGDNFFTDPIMLDYALKEHMKNDADYTRVERLPLGVTGEVMKVSAVKDCYSKIDPDKSEYLAVYMFNPDDYKCLTILPPEKFSLPFNTLTVDTPSDWERTQFIVNNLKKEHIYMGDIQRLSEKEKIPYYDMSREGIVKLPDDETVTYEKFREMYEERISKSMQSYMDEEYYDEQWKSRN